MRKISFLILLQCIIAIGLTAQPKGEKFIRQILSAQTIAWNNGQLDDFMQGYWHNDSLMFIGKRGISYGWQKALDNYRNSYPDTAAMGKLNFDLLQVKQLSADYFFVTGKWHLTRNIGDVGGIFTLIFKKINKAWFIIADHTS